MRDLIESIRKHPWFASITVWALLGAALKFFLDKFVLDGLRDLLFRAVGQWLGISDVNVLVGILSYAIPLGLAVAIIWGVYRVAEYNALRRKYADNRETTIILSPSQERLLSLIAEYQRQYAASKLIIDRQTGTLHFDDAPTRGEGKSLLRDLFEVSDVVAASKFESLVESIPPQYLMMLPESRWDNPFVVYVTEAGLAYLRRQAITETVVVNSSIIVRAEHRLRLAKLRTEGVAIRNQGQTLKSDLPEWIAQSQSPSGIFLSRQNRL